MNTWRIRIGLLNNDEKKFHATGTEISSQSDTQNGCGLFCKHTAFLSWDMQRKDIGSHIMGTDGLPEHIKNMRFRLNYAMFNIVSCTHQNQDVTMKFVFFSHLSKLFQGF